MDPEFNQEFLNFLQITPFSSTVTDEQKLEIFLNQWNLNVEDKVQKLYIATDVQKK